MTIGWVVVVARKWKSASATSATTVAARNGTGIRVANGNFLLVGSVAMGYLARSMSFVMTAVATMASYACYGQTGTSGSDSSRGVQPVGGVAGNPIWGVRYRSAQIDGVSILPPFAGASSLSLDVDVLQSALSIGARVGAEYIMNGGIDGQDPGSPFTEINGLVRGTIAGTTLRWDVYAGVCYSMPTFYRGRLKAKYGSELRWRLFGECGGLLLKASTSDGAPRATAGLIGVYLGWEPSPSD